MAIPSCGLYRTGAALAENEENVPSGVLVYFHDHSEQGPPIVLTPHSNTHNRWTFHERGWLVRDDSFLLALVPLKPEGFYVTSEHIHITKEEILPPRTLLQLGYNRNADSILFVGRFEGNTISFPTQGYSYPSPDVQKLLDPAGFRAPGTPSALHS